MLVLNVSVALGGSKAGVAEQLLDGQKVNALLGLRLGSRRIANMRPRNAPMINPPLASCLNQR